MFSLIWFNVELELQPNNAHEHPKPFCVRYWGALGPDIQNA